MDDRFDIIEYLSGLTGFTFDKAVLKRVALDRGVPDVQDYSSLDTKTKDLLRADLLYTAYISPDVWSSYTHAHGSFSQTTGSQTLNDKNRGRIYNIFMGIYRKYNDDKLTEIEDFGTVQWIDIL